jgi:hypothetical protein
MLYYSYVFIFLLNAAHNGMFIVKGDLFIFFHELIFERSLPQIFCFLFSTENNIAAKYTVQYVPGYLCEMVA